MGSVRCPPGRNRLFLPLDAVALGFGVRHAVIEAALRGRAADYSRAAGRAAEVLALVVDQDGARVRAACKRDSQNDEEDAAPQRYCATWISAGGRPFN